MRYERYIPVIVMLLMAGFFFRLGRDFQEGKEKTIYKVSLDSMDICDYCQMATYSDTLRLIDKNHRVVGEFLIK